MSFSDNAIDFINKKHARSYSLADNWSRNMENEAKVNAPWKDQSSHARQGLHGYAKMSGNEITISLSHGQEYGTFLETGTGIYGPNKKPIKPIHAKVLYWKEMDDSGKVHEYYFKSVKGMKAKPIVGPTMEKNKYKIRDSFIKLWEE